MSTSGFHMHVHTFVHAHTHVTHIPTHIKSPPLSYTCSIQPPLCLGTEAAFPWVLTSLHELEERGGKTCGPGAGRRDPGHPGRGGESICKPALGGTTIGSKVTNGLEERNVSLLDSSSHAKKASHSFCTGPMQKKSIATREVCLASGQAFLDGHNPKGIIQDAQATGLKVKVGFSL